MGKTKQGLVQIRVIGDAGQTEALSKVLTACLEEHQIEVLSCSCDYNDRFDSARKKFHIVGLGLLEEVKEEVADVEQH